MQSKAPASPRDLGVTSALRREGADGRESELVLHVVSVRLFIANLPAV